MTGLQSLFNGLKTTILFSKVSILLYISAHSGNTVVRSFEFLYIFANTCHFSGSHPSEYEVCCLIVVDICVCSVRCNYYRLRVYNTVVCGFGREKYEIFSH